MAKPEQSFTKVEARGVPLLLWVYDPKVGRGPLHISDKNAQNRSGNRVLLTRCGKGLTNYSHNALKEPLDRLCAKCGDEAAFRQAIEDSKMFHAARAAKQKVEDAAQRQEKCERIFRVWQLLNRCNRKEFDFRFYSQMRDSDTCRFEWDGHYYEVCEVEAVALKQPATPGIKPDTEEE